MDVPIGMVADNLTERGHPILAPVAALTLAVSSGKIVEPHLGRLLRRGGAAAARHGKRAAGDIMGRLKAAADANLGRTGSGATRPIAPKSAPEKVNIPPVSGSEAKIVTPGIREGVAARYEVVDAADIQASHKHDTFAKNPKYPKGIQERRYHDDPTEQYKVIDSAQNPEMRYLVTDNPDAINGPPIVTKDGVVLGGNSRAMTIQRMYSDHPENAAAYKETVRRNAERFGLDPDKVAGMEAPVLVRRTGVGDNKKSMTRLVSEFNRLDNRTVDSKIDIEGQGRLSAVAEQGKSFRDIPKSPEKASVLFRRIDDATPGLHDVPSGRREGGRHIVRHHSAGMARRRTVGVATGRIRRGPTHLDGERGAEQAAALVRDIRKSAQEKFYTIAVDADGKILNLHKYSKGKKGSTGIDAIEAAGFAANIPGVKKVYTIHNHPSGTGRASTGDRVTAHRLDSVFKLADIESEHVIVAGNKYLGYNYSGATSIPKLPGPVPKEQRIFETERHLKGPAPAERPLADVGDATQWARINRPGKAGLILMDGQNRPLDFFEYPKGTTRKKATAELVRRMESTNAGKLVAVTPRLTRRQENFFRKVSKAVSMDATLEDIAELKGGNRFVSHVASGRYTPPDPKPKDIADALSRSFDDLNTSKLLMHPGAVGGAAGFLGGFEADEDGGIRYNPARGLKYAVYGAGAGFGLNKGVRAFQASRAGKPPSKVRQAVTSGVTNFREAFEDDWRRVRLLTRQKDVDLTEANDMYAAETRYRGRLSARMEEAERIVGDIDRSVLAAARKYGMVDAEFYDDVSKYLIGKHVPERNARHGARAAKYSDKEAAGMVADVMQKPHFEDVAAVAGKIAALNRNTIDILLDAGVITKKLHTLLRTEYRNHVPLNRVLNDEDDVVQALLTSRGLDVRGSGLKRAKGSDLDIDDILANVVANHKAALVRAEKNILDLHTLKFARDNAHLELFEEIPANKFFIGTRPKEQGGGPIFEDVRGDPHILQMMENGKPVYLEIADTRLAAALKGVNRKQLGVVGNAVCFNPCPHARGDFYMSKTPIASAPSTPPRAGRL